MGLSGGSSSKSVSGSGQRWAQPFAKAAAGNVQDVFNQNQGNLSKLTDTITGTIPGLSSNFSGWNPSVGQSQDYYGKVLDGEFLDPSSNPGLSSVLDRNMNDVTGKVNSQFSLAGRYGSDAHGGALTRELADSNGAILADAYNRERANQGQAAGAVNDASNQSLAALLQAAGVGAELPYTGTNNLASSLSALFSGGTQTQKTSGGILGPLAQAGAAAASAGAFSDRRLKTNIRKVGEFADGLGRYVWTYIWGGPEQEGVMADEVERLRPWALGARVGGFQTVHYGLL